MEDKKRPLESEFYDPYKNPKVISIWQDTDGNWRGLWQKNGKMAESREVKPEDVLVTLLTHA